MRRIKFHWKKWFSQFSGRSEISMKVKLKSAHCCCSPSFTRTSWINILYLVQLTPWHFPFLKAQVIDGKVEDAEILRSWAYLVWRRCYQNTFSGKVHKSYIRHGAHYLSSFKERGHLPYNDDWKVPGSNFRTSSTHEILCFYVYSSEIIVKLLM